MTVIRPFELPDGRLVVQLITLGPGLCGGDAIHVDVSAEDGARVVVTTTAATRVMTMEPGQSAEQHVVLRAGPGASLEYYPRRHDSLSRQRTRANRAGRGRGDGPRRRDRDLGDGTIRARRVSAVPIALEPDHAARRRGAHLRGCHAPGAWRHRRRERRRAGRPALRGGRLLAWRAPARRHAEPAPTAARNARRLRAVRARPRLPARPRG